MYLGFLLIHRLLYLPYAILLLRPMTIAEMRERSNQAISGVPADLLIVAVVILFSTASFGLGMLADREMKGQGSGFWIENVGSTTAPQSAAAITAKFPEATAIPTVSAGTVVSPTTGKYL